MTLDDRVAGTFTRLTSRRAAYGWFVPGRIEIAGKHTDYAGGRSLCAAVSRGFAVAAGPRDDGRVRVADARERGAVEFDPHETGRPPRGWAAYGAVVARRLARNFPGARLGTDVVFASDLPHAAGLSSSSALVVAVATALVRTGRLEERPEWRAAIRSKLDEAAYFAAIESGASFATLPGAEGVGTHGGSEDHTAILNARAGVVSAYAYAPIRPAGDAPMPSQWCFVVMTSGVRASKSGAVRDQYNRASRAARALVELWNARSGEGQATLAAALTSRADAAAALRKWIEPDGRRPDGFAGFTADALRRRLDHFIAEDGRVPEMVAAFAHADTARVGELAAASQRDAETLLGNQTPETSRLAALAIEQGALAATSFGAGFGGSVWALAAIDHASEFARRWAAACAREHPHLRREGFVTRPGPGVTERR